MPLASTDWATAYQDIPTVQLGQHTNIAKPKILSFFLSNAPTTPKAEVIHALDWDIQGQQIGYYF